MLWSEIFELLLGHKLKHRNEIEHRNETVVASCDRAVYVARFSSLRDLKNIHGIKFSHAEELRYILL